MSRWSIQIVLLSAHPISGSWTVARSELRLRAINDLLCPSHYLLSERHSLTVVVFRHRFRFTRIPAYCGVDGKTDYPSKLLRHFLPRWIQQCEKNSNVVASRYI